MKQSLEVEGQRVEVTNVEKVLYPSGFTKGQIIDYYIHVSDYLLPHLAGRPITLKRYPNGVRGFHFYEKDAPKFKPKWVHTFPVPRRAGGTDICYVLVDDLPSLVWSANAANLELHPFLHRVPDLQRPTSIVFDLDPGEGVDVVACAQVAFLLKEKLAASGLESFAKVSGSKGIQLYAPLNTPVTYEQTGAFAHALAQDLERDHPDLVVSAMAKVIRGKHVFIDWSQNSDFKTTVAPYSLRAKRDRPYVSLPLSWKEMRALLDSGDASRADYEPGAALERLKRVGDLFKPLLRLKQKLPPSPPQERPAAPSNTDRKKGNVMPRTAARPKKAKRNHG